MCGSQKSKIKNQKSKVCPHRGTCCRAGTCSAHSCWPRLRRSRWRNARQRSCTGDAPTPGPTRNALPSSPAASSCRPKGAAAWSLLLQQHLCLGSVKEYWIGSWRSVWGRFLDTSEEPRGSAAVSCCASGFGAAPRLLFIYLFNFLNLV